MTNDQAVVGDEAGLRHASRRESGYDWFNQTVEYQFGETACGVAYAWHSGRSNPRMYFVDPEDCFPTCLWCASCP